MSPRMRTLLLALPLVPMVVPITGCSLAPPVRSWVQPLAELAPRGPKPWEKGNLARPEMTMGGDALDQRYTQHIYQSKEAAAGGSGVGGGGCGCN